MNTVEITKANFPSLVLEADKPVLLDFWAPWCGPCKMVGPIVEDIAADREDILVGKVNVDNEMELATQFGIVSIPTLVVIRDGKVAAQATGYRPRAEIESLLK